MLGFVFWGLGFGHFGGSLFFLVAVVSRVFNLNMTFVELWTETCVHVLVVIFKNFKFLLFLVDSFG